jgi:quercetin dioxygenase-like cupin family protein
MGIQVIAPGGYVREHSHMPNQEILFCLAGRGTIIVDGVPHPIRPGHDRLRRTRRQTQDHQ